MRSRFADQLFLAISVLLCTQGFLFVSVAGAQSVSDQVSELMRQQLEPWKTPVPEEAQIAPPELVGPLPPALPSSSGLMGPPSPMNSGEAPAGNTADVLSSSSAPPPAEKPKGPPKLTVGKETLRTAAMLARFYESRQYRPAWSNDAGPLPSAEVLLDTVATEAEREGLRPGDYRLAKLKALLQMLRQQQAETHGPFDPQALAELEFLLTDTFLLYGTHVSAGKKVTLNKMTAEWFVKQQKADLVSMLETAVTDNQLADILRALPPPHPGYRELREALVQYRDFAARGGWPLVPDGPKLQRGDRDERVSKLRARLQVTGELPRQSPDSQDSASRSARKKRVSADTTGDRALFDETLAQGVRKFQQQHGLATDGVVGFETVAALNVSADTRVQQIVINMERWRVFPRDLGPRHVDVNIPNFTLDVVEGHVSVLHMKVVVGKMMQERSTPTFSALMDSLVLNPYWYVPESIAQKELFPMSRKDPSYFATHGFVVRRVPIAGKQTADPNAADGAKTATAYRYLLRQEPGPKNALGRVKFMFPNAYGVYLHDTPTKELFNRRIRTFSHGCIRVEKPLDLAVYLLQGEAEWNQDAILAALDRGKGKTISLSTPVPVYIQYWTAWVDEEGTVQFRNDIYGYDGLPEARLPVTPPKPKPQLQEVQAAEQLQAVQSEPPPITPPASQPAPQTESQPMLQMR